jgi:uncharacterized protein
MAILNGKVLICAMAALLGVGLGARAWAAGPLQDARPSFDCGKAGAGAEAVICADPTLSARDQTLSVLFAAVRVSAAGAGPSNELARQREWLATRNRDCAKVSAPKACLATAYDDRLYELALAALFTSHDAAIAELTRQTPKDVPIYEAIYRYATIENRDARIKAVAPLIAPTFEATRVHPAQDFGNGAPMPARPEDRYQDIPTADVAAASDENFSAFIDVASEWTMDRDRTRLPCGALVRRPGLMAALGERWTPSTDCEAMLPPTPVLDHLLDLAQEATPPCQGTIRIDLGYEFEAFMVAKRLNLGDDQDRYTAQAGPVERRFRSGAQAQVAAATEEMTHYYTAYFGLAPSAARISAAKTVKGAVSRAFACEQEG